MKTLKVLKINLLVICMFVLFLLFTTGEAMATTYYVSPTGSDNNSGSINAPFRTIQKAADIVNPGDTVIVKNGVYTDTDGDNRIVYLSRSGTDQDWITFKSENKWGAKLYGQNNTPTYGIVFSSANYIRFEDFEFTGMKSGVWNNSASHHHVMYGNHFHDIGHVCLNPTTTNISDPLNGGGPSYEGVDAGYYTYDSNVFHDNGRPEGCGAYPDYHNYNHDHDLYLAGHDVTIINNVFYNHTAGWAIQMGGGSANNANWEINNNTFANHNPRFPGQVIIWAHDGYLPHGVTFQNNISNEPPTAFVNHYSADSDVVYYKNNLVYGGNLLRYESTQPQYQASNNITGQNPKFVDLANKNFRLQSSSPAIDKGAYITGHDYDADRNPIVGAADIGAYEYGGNNPPVYGDNTPPAPPKLY